MRGVLATPGHSSENRPDTLANACLQAGWAQREFTNVSIVSPARK
jgi:hypothetical protein